MSKKPDAQAFLAAMQGQSETDEPPAKMAPNPVPATPEALPTAQVHALPKAIAAAPGAARSKPGRAQLKHFGGYLDDETLEKIALLRIRLKKDNSELIKFAIEELHRKHNAKRAFGDA